MVQTFSPKVADEVGVNSAIIFQEICSRILANETSGFLLEDNRYWCSIGKGALKKHCYYLTDKQIETALESLVKGNYIIDFPLPNANRYSISEKGFVFYEEFAGIEVHHFGKANKEEEQDEQEELFMLEAEEEPENNKNKSVLPFEVFWKLYGKKVGRTQCEPYYESHVGEEDRKKILESINTYVESTPDKQYRKNPLTWLRQKAWDNEVIIKKTETIDKSQEGF